MAKIKVGYLEPHGKFEVRTVDTENGEINNLIGGYMECISYPGGGNNICICNEEGKLMGLEPNFKAGIDVIVGTVLFVGTKGWDFADLPESEIKRLSKVFESHHKY